MRGAIQLAHIYENHKVSFATWLTYVAELKKKCTICFKLQNELFVSNYKMHYLFQKNNEIVVKFERLFHGDDLLVFSCSRICWQKQGDISCVVVKFEKF